MTCSPRQYTLTLASLTLTGALAWSVNPLVSAQSRDSNRRTRFTHDSRLDDETQPGRPVPPVEALAGFSNQTNGFDPQGPGFETLTPDSVVPLRSFNDNRFIFEETETAADGLGPTYNAQSCRECHQNIVTGGASQVTVLRAGHLLDGQFFESQGGSLINSRATHPEASEITEPGERNVPKVDLSLRRDRL